VAIKNKTRYALLGVLAIKPSSGYDIKKFCDRTISHFWNENFGHIYPVLSQLEKEELIRILDTGDSSRKKIYQITEQGKEVLKDWMLEATEIQPSRHELLLKFSFGSNLTPELMIDMLETSKVQYQQKLHLLKTLEEEYHANSCINKNVNFIYLSSSFRYVLIEIEGILKWIDETIEKFSFTLNK